MKLTRTSGQGHDLCMQIDFSMQVDLSMQIEDTDLIPPLRCSLQSVERNPNPETGYAPKRETRYGPQTSDLNI